ncbi:hypothetical protein AB0C52_30695 [Streptomyces sp. NPDC048717]|uniref:hypothetical protein n=1 Tax=Streptomyces sp. NPDC048717 TaxID=3154928 RepID=UPI0034308786
MAGLLFLAFVYFAVGQAAAVRNGGQTAADAAALAAAQDARDQLRDGWLRVIGEPDQWGDYLNGEEYDSSRACDKAAWFAAENGSSLDGPCEAGPSGGGEEFHVWISTNHSVGRSSVPGTEGQHAKATATAVLEPLCSFAPPEQTPPPSPTTLPPSPEPTATPSPEPAPAPITGLRCRGVDWTIDPEHPRLPSAADLFTVRLVD